MKTFAVASVLALASVATAQLSAIPSCALNCFLEPLGADGCSDLQDFKCHCEKADSLFAAVTPCVQKACSTDDQQKTISAVEQTCKDAGVPVEVPTPGASGSAAPSTPAPTSEAASETPAPSTGAGGAISSLVSSAEASASSAIGSIVSSVVGTATGGSNATATATSSVSQFTGGAAQATQAAGLIGAAAIALLAL